MLYYLIIIEYDVKSHNSKIPIIYFIQTHVLF